MPNKLLDAPIAIGYNVVYTVSINHPVSCGLENLNLLNLYRVFEFK